jgi:hypothetical protein
MLLRSLSTSDNNNCEQAFVAALHLGGNASHAVFVSNQQLYPTSFTPESKDGVAMILKPDMVNLFKAYEYYQNTRLNYQSKLHLLSTCILYLHHYLPWQQSILLSHCLAVYLGLPIDPESDIMSRLHDLTSSPRTLRFQARLTIQCAMKWKMKGVHTLPLPKSLKSYVQGTDFIVKDKKSCFLFSAVEEYTS